LCGFLAALQFFLELRGSFVEALFEVAGEQASARKYWFRMNRFA
jgi:hypothetical protein